MIYEETVVAYMESRQKALDLLSEHAKKFLESDSTNIFCHPEIPEEVKYNIRDNFRIGSKETTLFVSDTSEKSERNKGLVVTDCGIYVILDSEDGNRKEYLSWKNIDRVMCGVNNECLDFFRENEGKFSVPLLYILRQRTITQSIADDVVTGTKIGRSFAHRLGEGVILATLFSTVGVVGGAAVGYLDRGLTKKDKKQICDYFAEIFTAMAETQKPENTDLVEEFFELPYDERKVIMLTNQHSGPHKKSACIFFNYECLPEIEFQLKRPVVNQLYVGHPHFPKRYYPVEEYKLELLKEKLDEFCEIMRRLGAEEIDIEDSRNSDDGKEESINNKVNGNASYKNINVSAGQEKTKQTNIWRV